MNGYKKINQLSEMIIDGGEPIREVTDFIVDAYMDLKGVPSIVELKFNGDSIDNVDRIDRDITLKEFISCIKHGMYHAKLYLEELEKDGV